MKRVCEIDKRREEQKEKRREEKREELESSYNKMTVDPVCEEK